MIDPGNPEQPTKVATRGRRPNDDVASDDDVTIARIEGARVGAAVAANGVSVPVPMTPSTPTSLGRIGLARSGRSFAKRTMKSLTTAREAQARTALNGIRILCASMAFLCLLGLPVIGLVPGAEVDKRITRVSVVVLATMFARLFALAARDDEFRLGRSVIPHVLAVCIAVTGLVLGIGMTTPVTGLVTLGILLFCLSAQPRFVTFAYGVLALGHAALTVLALRGVVSPTGLGAILAPSNHEILIAGVWVEAEYIAALAVGLLVNRESLKVMDELESAVRAASQREALLREVREELDRAAKLGGPGRFTGQEIGSFLLGEVIGRGGMGEVYAASGLDRGEPAAVKLLKRDGLADGDTVARFEREARTVAKLRSPHVVAVYEIGGPDAPVPYIAMERLEGQDLAAVLRTQALLGLGEARTLVREVAAGLDVAHEADVVHRDLKPNNLFRAESGGGRRTWKILDFGVSKLTTGEDATLTKNQIVGTPQYMAPEQAAGDRTIDRRVDVHALAAITYRAITGRPAFGRDEVAQVLLAVATELPVDPRKFVELHEDVALVLRIGLAKRPHERFATASDFAVAFEEAVEGRLAAKWREHGRRLLAVEPWGSKAKTID